MKWLKLLVPPEWDIWRIRDRITYFVVTGGIIGLCALGARAVGDAAASGVRTLLGQ